MDLFTYLLKKRGHNSSVNGDLFSYLLASRKRGTYHTYTGTQINVSDSINSRMKNWILGGNSNQNGTPTPDNPIDIHNVIGENNVIENSGKNLYDPIINTNPSVLNGITPELEINGTIKVSGTPTQEWSIICQYSNIYLEAGTYTFSIDKPQNFRVGIRYFTNKEQTTYNEKLISIGDTSITFTSSSNIYGWRVYLANLQTGVEINETLKLQVETGSTATPFEKYKGRNYKVSLASRNLAQSIFQTTYYQKYYASLFVEAQLLPNTQYTLSFKASESGHNLYLNENISTIQYITTTGDRQSITFTTKSTLSSSNPQQYESGKGWQLLKNWENNTHYITYSEVQLELGDTATPYVSYMTPIELCKIGDYQDKIYKSNDKWLLEKNVGKYTFTGNETITKQTEGFLISEGNWNAYTNNNCLTNSILYSNYYTNYTTYTDLVAQTYGIGIIYNSLNNLYIRNTTISNVEDFKDWLSQNNVDIYYQLKTPNITEITDENLINQLEELNKARSFEEKTNISQLSEQLPFDLTVDIKTL